jgi:hypothetical protein
MVERPWKRRVTTATLAVFGLACLPVLWVIGSEVFQDWRHRQAFDADRWQRQGFSKYDPDWPPRLCMADHLIGGRILLGKTEAQVIALLGRPTDRMTTAGTSASLLSYYLGPERGLFRIDSETLCIEVGTDGKVSRQWIHRD